MVTNENEKYEILKYVFFGKYADKITKPLPFHTFEMNRYMA